MAQPINLQVKLKGIYADTYRLFTEHHSECETHRDTVSTMLRTLPEYQTAIREKELAEALSDGQFS